MSESFITYINIIIKVINLNFVNKTVKTVATANSDIRYYAGWYKNIR